MLLPALSSSALRAPRKDAMTGEDDYLAAIRGGDFASAAAIAEISGFMK